MNRRHVLFASASLVLPGLGHGQPFTPQEGVHFISLRSRQPVADEAKVEVLEFFSYACPHCYEFDPHLERWLAKLPSDVVFRRVPVPFLRNHDNLQRTYFALEAAGGLKLAHTRVFDAIHRDRMPLATPGELADLVAKAGVNREKFAAAFNAFSTASQLARAKAATANYEIDQVPMLAVAGRYLTTPSRAGGAEAALATLDFLIQKSRKG